MTPDNPTSAMREAAARKCHDFADKYADAGEPEKVSAAFECSRAIRDIPLPEQQVTEAMVERACKAAWPALWSDDPVVAHQAASPILVSVMRDRSVINMRHALTAALQHKDSSND